MADNPANSVPMDIKETVEALRVWAEAHLKRDLVQAHQVLALIADWKRLNEYFGDDVFRQERYWIAQFIEDQNAMCNQLLELDGRHDAFVRDICKAIRQRSQPERTPTDSENHIEGLYRCDECGNGFLSRPGLCPVCFMRPKKTTTATMTPEEYAAFTGKMSYPAGQLE